MMSETNKTATGAVTSTRLFEGAEHADLYLKCRPDWPEEIIQKTLAFLQEKKSGPFELAVDVGCGSGQATRPLASHIKKVVGVDVSVEQIRAAQCVDNPPNVEFRTGSGEAIPVSDKSVDLVTCAQAVHWFDFDVFFREVDRVLKPGGCVAIYSYHIFKPWVDGDDKKNEQLYSIVTQHDTETCGPYNSPRILHLQNMLADVHIPYEETIRDNTLAIRQDTTMKSYIGYLESRSGYQSYLENNPDDKADPLKEVQERLMDTLGLDAPAEYSKINIRSPIAFLLGRKPDNN
ncbi:putative methyltransferase DDB_G0268948 [Acanthaster planci]|uniref:Methyltransferase DDB_G0268948 n=1 Tax=Acanthaster planci TaxID=133434 RepID=A0A8B7Z707_ACAPL|nr:putative methyltransferase DDB_G0268948 [Acanthaster planci]